MIYCGECGALNDEHSERCRVCNAKLTLPAEESISADVEYGRTAGSGVARRYLGRYILTVFLLVLLASIAWAVSHIDNQSIANVSGPTPTIPPEPAASATVPATAVPTSVLPVPTAEPTFTPPVPTPTLVPTPEPTMPASDDVIVAPSGRIAFSSDRPVPGRNNIRKNRDIYSIRADGTGLVRLTGESSFDGMPSWAPTGEQIAFVSDRTGSLQIWIMNSDGSNPYQLTYGKKIAQDPDWSPDGKYIAYTLGQDSGIAKIPAKGGRPIVLTDLSYPQSAPAWSPDGSKITFMGKPGKYWQVFVMNADGSGLRQITHDPIDHRFPRWMPDGKRIIYNTRKSEHVIGQIFIMNADGTNVTQITMSTEGENGRPFPSPDGRYIVFNSNRLDNNWEIYIMRPDGSEVKRLTNTIGDDFEPCWSP